MDQIELSVLNKTTRRDIREDIFHFNSEMIKEALEESWSIKKAKKTISKVQFMLPFLKSENQNKMCGRDDIIKVAKDFYKELYSVPNEEHGGPSLYSGEERGDTLEFLISKVSKILKSLKNGKVAGPDKMENATSKFLA